MRTPFVIALAALLAGLAGGPAHAGTDRKVISGIVCVPTTHLARGVVALEEVELVCPLLRDSTQSKLKSLRVNFQRGLGVTPQNQNPPGGTTPFRGRLYSCSSTEHVSADSEGASCPFTKG